MDEVYVLVVEWGGDLDVRVFGLRSTAEAAFTETVRDAEAYFGTNLTSSFYEDYGVAYWDFSAEIRTMEVE